MKKYIVLDYDNKIFHDSCRTLFLFYSDIFCMIYILSGFFYRFIPWCNQLQLADRSCSIMVATRFLLPTFNIELLISLWSYCALMERTEWWYFLFVWSENYFETSLFGIQKWEAGN